MKMMDVVRIIEQIADPALAEHWDNCGMQIDSGREEVKRVLTVLEITQAVVIEARRMRADLIVCHHPLIFTPIQNIRAGRLPDQYMIELIRRGISVYAAHTSFDKALEGNNWYLAKQIGLVNLRTLDESGQEASGNGSALVGELKEAMTLREVCGLVSEALHLPRGAIKAAGSLKQEIQKVGLCTGAGGGMMGIARKNGCHVFITGDIKYHDAQIAKECGFCLIDAGHYGTEKSFAENFARQLLAKTNGQIEIVQSKIKLNPFSIR